MTMQITDEMVERAMNALIEHDREIEDRPLRAALEAALNHAGDGPGPSTLAAQGGASPSVSRRGEPAPDTVAIYGNDGSFIGTKPRAAIESIIREACQEAAHAVIDECARIAENGCSPTVVKAIRALKERT